MKGTIVKCLEEMVVSQFGKNQWQEIVRQSGTGLEKVIILPITEIEDAKIMTVVQKTCEILKLTVQQAADAFGDYWMNVYAPKYYNSFLKKHTSAKTFLLDTDNIHVQMTHMIKDAKPPRFKYEWKNPNTLLIDYSSQRGLIDFAVGLCKGVGKYYHEDLQVRKLSDSRVEVVFPGK